jgi:hypothetical protein
LAKRYSSLAETPILLRIEAAGYRKYLRASQHPSVITSKQGPVAWTYRYRSTSSSGVRCVFKTLRMAVADFGT